MNKIAASVAVPNTDECLAELHRLRPLISAAEVRLDLMDEFDVERIVGESPVPLVITFRPIWEGGRFAGAESFRLDVLRRAAESGAAYIDVEADVVDTVSAWAASSTKIIASKHWYETMPHSLFDAYSDLKQRCDVVKLVGMANTFDDLAPVVQLLDGADTPVIALAMGEPGCLVRIVAPAFAQTVLTYGSTTADKATAPGQLTVEDMHHRLGLAQLNAHTDVTLRLGASDWQTSWGDSAVSVSVPAPLSAAEALAGATARWSVERS